LTCAGTDRIERALVELFEKKIQPKLAEVLGEEIGAGTQEA
jgi:hypothetical protein